ncbi:proteasome adapter and scaffold protein ECM29-like isoform X1 [Mytilus galloprovincialis]|uniref:proteasome adapter and scaffold protein ECM29-like isoform X1 n=1 Tax=Mytilus galloprovincialis TaxID=29158 RepID=UPI003F7C8CAB
MTDESSLIERVFLRIGSAETDDQLQTALAKFLTPVILKLNSGDEAVRKKVMELLVHINKRLKSLNKVQLPVESLITQYLDPSASSIITNFSIIYIRMGYPRLEPAKQAELVPLLIKCLDGKPNTQQDSILHLMLPALEHVKMPQDDKQKQQIFGLTEKPLIVKVMLDYMMDILLLPYNAHISTPTQTRPSTAPAGGPGPTTTLPPPGLSEYSKRRVLGDSPLNPEALEKAKIGVLKFLGSGLIEEKMVVCHYVIASSDTRHSVATAADLELKRITGSVDWNSLDILNKLYTIFQGTIDIKGKPATKPDHKRRPVCTRIRLKIFPFFLRARDAANVFPSCIQVIFDCLYGQSTNAKLKNMAVQFVHHVCLNCADNKFTPVAPVLLSGMVKLIGEAMDEAKLRNLAYVAVGKIVRRAPQLVKKDVALVQKFFDAMSKEDPETRLGVQESLSLMADAFKDIDPSCQSLMEALIMQNIEQDQPQSRLMSVQYARTVFPSDHIPSRYILLLACGDTKEDVRVEAMKALHIAQTKEKEIEKNSTKLPPPKLPKFTDMMKYISEKGSLRVKTQNKYVIGNYTLPFIPATYEEMILYLHMCLSQDSGQIPDMESLVTMQTQAPGIAKYIRDNLQGDNSIQTYFDFIKTLLSAVSGSSAMYCLVELVAIAPEMASQIISQTDWMKNYMFSSKDDLKEFGSQMYAVVICQQSKDIIKDSMEELMKNLNNKGFEVQMGSVIGLGYLIGQYLNDRSQSCTMEVDGTSKVEEEIKSIITTCLQKLAAILLLPTESNVSLKMSACLSLGEIGRNAQLLLPSGGGDDGEGEITKLSIVTSLLKILKSGSEPNKIKEKCVMCLGYLCVGEENFPHLQKVMEEIMDSVQPKQFELHMTTGEALVCAAQGRQSSAARDLWTESEEDYRNRVTVKETKVEWYLESLLNKSLVSSNPHLRQAACIWLLALTKTCGPDPAVQSKLSQIQGAFMRLLSENDDITQDIASKGLGLVYEICTPEQKDSLVSELVDTLMTGKRVKHDFKGDTTVFEEGSLGKSPDGGSLSTYKELCAIANDLNQPDLIYKFMHLANHNAMWNSRKGAAFGFSTIASQAGEQLRPYLAQIVPRLYRYQFDPNPKIQQAMSSIWNALIQDNKDAVDKFISQILYDLNKNLTSTQWRIRESSCLAVNDLLRGRPLDDVVDQLPELWENCLRVRDDIKESVRNAADLACRSLSRASIKICDINYGKLGEKATRLVMPCLLKHSLQSSVSEVRAIGLSTMLKISKNAGPLLKPNIPVLVTALLEAVSGLEPQVLNYFSLQVSSNQKDLEKLDSARIAASRMSPMMETVNYCVQYIDSDVLVELVPRLTDLIKSGIGIGTKAGCSSFVIQLVHHCPQDLTPFAGKLMSAFLAGLSDRNSSVRKTYASALGHLIKVAKDSSVEKLIIKLKSWYLDKEDEAARHACGLTLQSMCHQSQDIMKRHATQAVPLAFFAMHEKKPETEDKSSKDNMSVWEEIWLEITPGTEAGIRLYLQEIMELLQTSIDSQSWATKAQAADAMSTVAEKLKDKLGPPHLGNLLTTLLSGLQGRIWTGKETLIQAIDTVCCYCKENLSKETEGQPSIEKVVDSMMKESKKERLEYKLEALKCTGNILEEYSLDRFSEIWQIAQPDLSKAGNKNGEDDDIKPEMKQKKFNCYFEILGQSWPSVVTTQDEFGSNFSDLLLTSLLHNTWKIQVTILKSLFKLIDRYHIFQKDKILLHKAVLQGLTTRMLETMIPSLGNIKYTVIRHEALSTTELLINKVIGVDGILSSDILSKVQDALSAMSGDSSPELQDKSHELLKQITVKISTME